MNILVTGSSGFIGGHLYQQLTARGHTPIPMDSSTGTPTTDLDTLSRTIEANEVEMIAHLGASCSTAVSLQDPARDFHANALGTFNVAEAARQAGGIPVIYTSTVKVHPGEDGRTAPLGLSKRIGEDYLRLYGSLYGLPHIILRPSTIYGPGQEGSPEAGWVTWFLRAVLETRRITIHGDGTQSRDILHIDDMTALLIDIVEHFDDYSIYSTYDVGGGPANEITLLELLAYLSYEDIAYDARLPGDLQRVVTTDPTITNIRGWEPCIGWRAGVLSTLDWMRRHR